AYRETFAFETTRGIRDALHHADGKGRGRRLDAREHQGVGNGHCRHRGLTLSYVGSLLGLWPSGHMSPIGVCNTGRPRSVPHRAVLRSAQEASSRATCSGVSATFAAAAEATAVAGRLLPGIGMTREPLASIQAKVTCC